MSIWSLTYPQSVFKGYDTDKHFSELLPTRWRQKSTDTDMEQNYVTVTYDSQSSDAATTLTKSYLLNRRASPPLENYKQIGRKWFLTMEKVPI